MARKNLYTCTSAEWARVVDALAAMKRSGVYDTFTRRHHHAMMQASLLPGETGTRRNVAHRGPGFLPWHRQALLDFEAALQAADGGATPLRLPYWPWQADGSGWRTAKVWTYVGGNGSSSRSWRVPNGPFAGWTSTIWNGSTFASRAGVKRQFASSGAMPAISSTTMGVTGYDAAPWNEFSSTSTSFRWRFESSHNSVHNLVGGDMSSGTSPNDPLFWLHHANVDRVWAEWQARHGTATYEPRGAGPAPHNLDDEMPFLATSGVTPADVLDFRAIGVAYDTVR